MLDPSNRQFFRTFAVVALLLWGQSLALAADPANPLAGTAPLEMSGDIASQLVDGVSRFLDEQTKLAVKIRRQKFQPDTSSDEAYLRSIEPHRQRLAKMVGVVDPLEPFHGFEWVDTTARSAVLRETSKFVIRAVRWPVVRGVHGEGLLVDPLPGPARGGLVLVPNAGETPESLGGLEGDPLGQAIIVANAGVRVLIPTIIDYGTSFSKMQGGRVETGLTHREFCYRPAFELGRHILGYETQKVMAGARGLLAEGKVNDASFMVSVAGRGEGALIALFAGALDSNISTTVALGRDLFLLPPFLQPINRNLFGLTRDFGLAELAMLIAPRKVFVGDEKIRSIPFLPAGGRGAPVPGLQKEYPNTPEGKAGREKDLLAMYAPYVESRPIEQEFDRWKSVVQTWDARRFPRIEGGTREIILPYSGKLEENLIELPKDVKPVELPSDWHSQRMKRQIDEIITDTQFLLEESPYIRDEWWAKTRPAREARDPQKWSEATVSYRQAFYDDVIGRFDLAKLPPNPRTRKAYDQPTYTAYEVVLDVFPDVFAYGLLLVPKGIKPDEKRPVVVAQHGLEGRPQDLADPKINNSAYNQFGCRLAERGFVVFAPQNLYIFEERFRVLQRKLNPLGKTLFSIIIPQHEQIVDWLSTLSFVDPQRIGFYGLSYGGKSAMRIPAVVEKYALSICSADFNDWIWKNASTRSPYSYVGSPEYEIFEFDLGMTFNYGEMAGLICPRPFMVERGHHDGVAPDDRVAAEYAKVRRLYVDLKIPERTEIEWFDGPHTIHGVGTFEFLHRHLNWPSPSPPQPLDGTKP